jgi:hypothetical protein
VYSATGRYPWYYVVEDREVDENDLEGHFGKISKINNLDYYAFTGKYHGKKVEWNIK